eukprot:379993_1
MLINMSQIVVTEFFTNAGINLCVSSSAALHNLVLLIYHIQKILKILKKSGQKLHRTYLLSITTISMIILFNMYVVLLNMSVVLKVNIVNCNTRASIAVIMIFLSKIALYILLFERLFVIFRNSQFAFSKTKIIVTRIIICLVTITCIFPLIFEKNGKIYSDGNCKTNVKIYLKAMFILLDLGISIWIMVLFSRRLWLLSLNTFSNSEESSMMSGSSHYTHTHTHITKPRSNSFASQKQEKKYIRKMNKQLLRVMTKTNLLTLIAIITNEMNVVIISFAPSTVWPMIDSMVNCWCVLLMFKSHEKIFDCMCKYASKTISDQCLIFCACPCCVQLDKQDDEIIEEIINGNDNGNNNDNSDTNGTPVAPKTNVIDNNINAIEIEPVTSISPSAINDNKQCGQMKLEIDNMNDTHFKFGMEHDIDEQIVEHDYQHSTHL